MAIKGTLELEERRRSLTELLASSGELRIEDLAARFQVSAMTIRRDLEALEDLGVVRRVRGGAVGGGAEPFAARKRRAAKAKAEIAEKLMELVPRKGAICMDASSTMSQLASSLPETRGLSVVTDGLETFRALGSNPDVQAYVTGGQQDPNTGSLIGPIASATLRQFSFNRALLSATAVNARFGSSEGSAEECEIKRLMSELSDHVVMAVDSQKLGAGAASRCLSWSAIDLLVTELDPADPLLDPFRASVEIL
jgi:DeoR/GlpR family transcriptional regulator of sugar metabolism